MSSTYAPLSQESRHGGSAEISDSLETGAGTVSALHNSSKSSFDVERCHNHPETKSHAEQKEYEEVIAVSEDSSHLERLAVLVRQAIPVMISFLLSNSAAFINLMFAGHYEYSNGDKSIVFAGISLANMFANVTCQSLIVGMSGAIETLGSQNNGAGNFKEVGYVLQRSYCIISCMALPFMLLWYHSGDFFRQFGVDGDVCDVVTAYLRVRMFCIPLDVFNISYEKYLMSIAVVKPSMYSFIAFNLSVLGWDTLFCHVLQLPYISLAWAWVLAAYTGALVQRVASRNDPAVVRTTQSWDKQALTKWWEFIQLGLPGTIMLCSEWWAFELLTMFASILGTAAVAAQSVIVSTAAFVFMIPLGVGIATASLVGNSLGAGQRDLAMQLAKLSLVFQMCLNFGVCLVVYFAAPSFMTLFTTDKEVLDMAEQMVPFLALFVFVDSVQGVAAGILRGCGKQTVGAISNVVAFYVVGLPIAWYLTFHTSLGVMGLMLGISCGTSFQDVVALTLVLGFPSYTFPRLELKDGCDGGVTSGIPVQEEKSLEGLKVGDFSVISLEDDEDDIDNKAYEEAEV